MATFKELKSSDITAARSFLSQLVDVIQEDVSGSTTRRTYQVFVTGGVGPGVTSSIFQTVYDQDFSLQTANPVFDMTVGLYSDGSTVTDASTGQDSAGKLLFASNSLMMREKVENYEQFAQVLLGNATSRFKAPLDSTDSDDNIDEAMFITFKRLFSRDRIKRETFAMKFFQSASRTDVPPEDGLGENLTVGSESGSVIFTDAGSATDRIDSQGGEVSNIVDSADTSRRVGLLFLDHGTAVFDLAKIISGTQHVSGVINAMNANSPDGIAPAGTMIIGQNWASGELDVSNPNATFIPDFMVSASIDNIVDHFASTRFGSGSQTAMTFQNITNINSTLIFCRSTADEFNYSSNPTYVDSENRIVVIDQGQEETQRSFTMVTTVGLYDPNDNLLAVAKLSRPVEKQNEKDLTFRVRLDFTSSTRFTFTK